MWLLSRNDTWRYATGVRETSLERHPPHSKLRHAFLSYVVERHLPLRQTTPRVARRAHVASDNNRRQSSRAQIFKRTIWQTWNDLLNQSEVRSAPFRQKNNNNNCAIFLCGFVSSILWFFPVSVPCIGALFSSNCVGEITTVFQLFTTLQIRHISRMESRDSWSLSVENSRYFWSVLWTHVGLAALLLTWFFSFGCAFESCLNFDFRVSVYMFFFLGVAWWRSPRQAQQTGVHCLMSNWFLCLLSFPLDCMVIC